jgi:hypothetical protein
MLRPSMCSPSIPGRVAANANHPRPCTADDGSPITDMKRACSSYPTNLFEFLVAEFFSKLCRAIPGVILRKEFYVRSCANVARMPIAQRSNCCSIFDVLT